MRKSALFVIAVLFALPAAADEVNETRDADADGRVVIWNMSGSVEVVGWDRNEVQVTGTIGDDVEDFIFDRSGETTKIKVKVPDRRHGHKDVSSELVIRVPRGSSVDVGSVSADIDVEGTEGEQELETVSGDIETEGFASDITAQTVSGDIDVDGDGSAAEWDLATVSGDIEVDSLSGELDIEVVSGDIDVRGGVFDDVHLESVNGDITFNAGLRENGRFDAESVNGSVEVEFVGSVSGRFKIETFNGRIRNCFGPQPERTSRYAPGWELDFEEGSGSGRVTIATLNGGVELCKE